MMKLRADYVRRILATMRNTSSSRLLCRNENVKRKEIIILLPVLYEYETRLLAPRE